MVAPTLMTSAIRIFVANFFFGSDKFFMTEIISERGYNHVGA